MMKCISVIDCMINSYIDEDEKDKYRQMIETKKTEHKQIPIMVSTFLIERRVYVLFSSM